MVYVAQYYDHMMYDHSYGWFGFIWMLVFLAVLVGMALLVLRILGTRNGAGPTKDPLDIAKARYAKGEITKAEYTDIKKELGNN